MPTVGLPERWTPERVRDSIVKLADNLAQAQAEGADITVATDYQHPRDAAGPRDFEGDWVTVTTTHTITVERRHQLTRQDIWR